MRASRQPGRNSATRGFSLLEVVISLIFLTIISLNVLHSFSMALQFYAAAKKRSDRILQVWNQAQQIRWQMDSSGVVVTTVPPGLPLYESSVEDAEQQLEWRVLHGTK